MSGTTTAASTVRRILVIGGNGFIGSAVCKAAIARGIQVTSVSSSGRPYRTAKGHSPAWTSKVDWQKGDALNPSTFSHLFPQVDGVVHTLGLLLEDTSYKQAIRDGSIIKLLGSVWKGVVGDHQEDNPLKRGSGVPPAVSSVEGASSESVATWTLSGQEDHYRGTMTYELMNRDSALRVCKAFVSSDSAPVDSPPESKKNASDAERNNSPDTSIRPRPFIYVSAEDIFRPLIPARYISTKREAEQGIEKLISEDLSDRFRGVYIRPSLVYHAHHRPLTTPAAALLDLSATLHRKAPRGIPTPSGILRSLSSLELLSGTGQQHAPPPTSAYAKETSLPGAEPGLVSLALALESVANALTIPPIHVDTVADAICESLDSTKGIEGVVDVSRMRALLGWREASEDNTQPRLDTQAKVHV